MKPLNANSQSCDPISSNCVIWGGPDIECIKLCKGDTVTEVVYKLATELCLVMDTLDITNYNEALSCFNITSCGPKDFEALINFLIARICQLEACNPDCVDPCTSALAGTPGRTVTSSATGISGCPDCTIIVAKCFQFKNQFGDTVTEMQLIDYVVSIGNYICSIAGQIATINTILAAYNVRITALELAPAPVFTLPEFVPVCVLPAVTTPIDVILQALEAQFCALRSATGTPDQIYQAIAFQCSNLNNSPTLGISGGTMGGLTGWVNSPSTLADSITNMWLTICDLRSAVATIQVNCCPSGCEGISIDMQITLVGANLTLFFTGTIPAGFVNCVPTGTLFKIQDSLGNFINTNVDILSNLNNPAGVSISLTATPVDFTQNLTITATPCFTNASTGVTCESCLEGYYNNIAVCPALVLTPTATDFLFSSTITTTGNYTIEVWDSTATVLLDSYSEVVVAPGVFTGTIGSLTASTEYKVRLTITIGSSTTTCPYYSVTTLSEPLP